MRLRAVRANKNLHFAVYQAARLPALTQIITGLWLKIGPVLNLDMRSSTRRLSRNEAERHHAALVAALVASDSTAKGRSNASTMPTVETESGTCAE